MARKGRFNLLAYFIENSLIFYKSIKKKESIIAFSIFKSKNLTGNIEILNNFLKRKFLYYYSIQINPCEIEELLFILCFRDLRKSNIIKFYNLVKEKVTEINRASNFFYDKELENKFMNIFEGTKKSTVKICKKNGYLLLNDKNIMKILQFYTLDLNYKDKKDSVLYFLLNLFKDFNKKGSIIFNFKSNDTYNINLSAFYVDILKVEDYKKFNLEYEVNKFFDYKIVRKHISSIKDLAYLVWRFRISEDPFISNNFKKLFSIEKNDDVKDLIKFNQQFEQILNQNEINFQRLRSNLFFIEEKILFLTLAILDSKLIHNLSERFYLKYKIYILFLDDEEYQKVEKIKDLEHLKILNYNNFPNLEIFNKEFFLKDA